MIVRARLLVRGRVQGVWYRGAMQERAEQLGVTGWVRNQRDGAVEAEVEGDRATVQTLIAWAHEGPPSARVSEVVVEWIDPKAEPRNGFEIRR
jgi:acylphosphatase